MRVVYHHEGHEAVWEDAYLFGTQYMIDVLLDIVEHHHEPVSLTVTGPHIRPSMWTHDGAIAAGLAAGYYMTGDQPESTKVPPGAIP